MKKIITILVISFLQACSTAAPKNINDFSSRLVYHPSHEYHGVDVKKSSNWMLGRSKGIMSNPGMKLDVTHSNIGAFFKHAKPLGVPMSSSVATSENTGMCVQNSEHNDKTLIEEWIVHFNSNGIKSNDFSEIKSELKKIKPGFVHISGYTDDLGSDLYNYKLSEKRAKNIANELSVVWSDTKQQVTWSGECPRLVMNTDDKSRSKNRRVHIKAYKSASLDKTKVSI